MKKFRYVVIVQLCLLAGIFYAGSPVSGNTWWNILIASTLTLVVVYALTLIVAYQIERRAGEKRASSLINYIKEVW